MPPECQSALEMCPSEAMPLAFTSQSKHGYNHQLCDSHIPFCPSHGVSHKRPLCSALRSENKAPPTHSAVTSAAWKRRRSCVSRLCLGEAETTHCSARVWPTSTRRNPRVFTAGPQRSAQAHVPRQHRAWPARCPHRLHLRGCER